MKCSFHINGCEFTGSWTQVTGHFQDCAFRLVQCECRAKLKLSEIKTHFLQCQTIQDLLVGFKAEESFKDHLQAMGITEDQAAAMGLTPDLLASQEIIQNNILRALDDTKEPGEPGEPGEPEGQDEPEDEDSDVEVIDRHAYRRARVIRRRSCSRSPVRRV